VDLPGRAELGCSACGRRPSVHLGRGGGLGLDLGGLGGLRRLRLDGEGGDVLRQQALHLRGRDSGGLELDAVLARLGPDGLELAVEARLVQALAKLGGSVLQLGGIERRLEVLGRPGEVSRLSAGHLDTSRLGAERLEGVPDGAVRRHALDLGGGDELGTHDLGRGGLGNGGLEIAERLPQVACGHLVRGHGGLKQGVDLGVQDGQRLLGLERRRGGDLGLRGLGRGLGRENGRSRDEAESQSENNDVGQTEHLESSSICRELCAECAVSKTGCFENPTRCAWIE